MTSMEEIYRQHSSTVYRYLLAETGNPDLAEELTQETFYQAVRSIGRFDGKSKISTWLCAIAKNQWRLYCRKNPSVASFEPAPQDGPEGTVPAELVFPEDGASELLARERRIDLMRQLHTLPDEMREVLYLRVFGNLSFREIGEVLGWTENRARVTYYRGRVRLRQQLEEHDMGNMEE